MKIVVEGTEKELHIFFSVKGRQKLVKGRQETPAKRKKGSRKSYKWNEETVKERILDVLSKKYDTYPTFQKAVIRYNPSKYQRTLIDKVMRDERYRANISSKPKELEQLRGAKLKEKVNEMKEDLKPRIIEHLHSENWKPRTTLIKEVNQLSWPHGAMLNAIEDSIAELVKSQHVKRFNMGRNVYFRRSE